MSEYKVGRAPLTDLTGIRGIVVRAECTYCTGTGRIKGRMYMQYGEMTDCPICRGMGEVDANITVEQLKTLLGIDQVLRDIDRLRDALDGMREREMYLRQQITDLGGDGLAGLP